MGFGNFLKRKRNNGVIDFASLQRKGIFHPKEEKSETLDLSKSQVSDSSPLGFLGNFAATASGSNPNMSDDTELESSIVLSTDRKQKLKGILRDMKMKLDSTNNRMYKISERLELIESKIERLERRSGV